MSLIVDTSIILAAILGEPEKPFIEKLTVGEELIAPSVLTYEVGNAFSRMIKRSRMTAAQVREAVEIYLSIPVRLVETDLRESLDISISHRIYAYDACFIEAARRLRQRLLTLDLEMMRVARDCGVKVMEVRNEGL